MGAGFGRTDTMALKVALETPGFGPCYRMIEIFEHPEHVEFWRAAWRGEPVDWDGRLGGYETAVGWPARTFYEELVRRDPDARVLLSVGDPERWCQSTRNTIHEISKITGSSRLSRAIYAFFDLLVPGVLKIGRTNEEIIWRGTFDGRFEDRPYAIEVFNRHNEEVRRRLPANRLLVYEGRGARGLCASYSASRCRMNPSRASTTRPRCGQDTGEPGTLTRRARCPGAAVGRRSNAPRGTSRTTIVTEDSWGP